MARGEQDRHRAPPKRPSTGPPRSVVVSKLLSRILRHNAVKEGLQMSPEGYINVSDLLSWHGAKKIQVTMDEIIEAVSSNDKQRFGLKYIGRHSDADTANDLSKTLEATTLSEADPNPSTAPVLVSAEPSIPNPAVQTSPLTSAPSPLSASPSNRDSTSSQPSNNAPAPPTSTSLALTRYTHPTHPDTLPSHYTIRATQGHSISTLSFSTYLTPLTPTSADLPSTVVHGTFHASWPLILSSGGLRPMSRTHIHFATGPSLDEVLTPPTTTNETSGDGKGIGKAAIKTAVLGGTVISGMRHDAQVLIYIDLHRAMSSGVPFWRSENGVILSEGIPSPSPPSPGGKERKEESMVSTEFFDKVVEIHEGLGVLWEGGAVVKEMPERLAEKGLPRGKGRGRGGGDAGHVNSSRGDPAQGRGKGKGRGKGAEKPGLKVEKGHADFGAEI
ncbi:MAG: hypothetical protein Q9227_001746 [Pyrenula ochraceoflavens]